MKVVLFVQLFVLYKRHHGVKYSFTRAKEIAFQGFDF